MDVSGRRRDCLAVRPGTLADHPAVCSFATDTWGEGSDYVPHVYPRWIEAEREEQAGEREMQAAGCEARHAERETQRTFVAVDREAEPPSDPESVLPDDAEVPEERPDGRAVGVCQAVRLSDHEGWVQAMRVDPDYRGEGLSTLLNDAAFAWLADRGCVVARNMVFSWNVAGLGGSRAAGFDPCAEFRWAHPDPADDAGGGAGTTTEADADAAWTFWQGCDARTHLRGLTLDGEESWALSELTRERLRTADDEGRLQVVRDDGVRGVSLRNRTYDREDDDGEQETWAEYAVAAWADPGACASLMAAVARDAAGVDADRTRVLIPETARWVSDVAAARVELSEEPDFVMAADLTRRPWERD